MAKKTYDVKILAKVTLDDDARPPDVVLFDDTPREGGE
jgi:hypothetical protein